MECSQTKCGDTATKKLVRHHRSAAYVVGVFCQYHSIDALHYAPLVPTVEYRLADSKDENQNSDYIDPKAWPKLKAAIDKLPVIEETEDEDLPDILDSGDNGENS